MKRREFLESAILAGAMSATKHTHASGGPVQHSGPGFDIHPFLKAHPDAVFIVRTDIDNKMNGDAIFNEGEKLARDLIVPVKSGGWPLSTLVAVKHNWHGIQTVPDLIPENTDSNFTEGWITGMMPAGPRRYYVNRSQDMTTLFKHVDLVKLAEEGNVDLTHYNADYWTLPDGAVHFIDIPDGVVFEQFGFISPFNTSGTFLVNLAKIKAHSMGITGAVKNLQGLTPAFFRHFCCPYDQVRKRAGKEYGRFLKRRFEKKIENLYEQHIRDGFPRWHARKGLPTAYAGGIWQEQWTQRMIDAYTVSPTHLSIIEGIYAMDGNGFGDGPHSKSPNGYSSRDYMTNVIIFGLDPFRIDIVMHWLAGHEPGNFGLFHIGIERGVSDVLDPNDIPLYEWVNGQATVAKLDDFPRTLLKTPFLQLEDEPKYHMCDEPFDYSAWKKGIRTGLSPSIRPLGRDGDRRLVMEMEVPEPGGACVDIYDADGTLVWRMDAGNELPPGIHQVVWDGFSSPGLHNVYVKGMGWDAHRRIVTGV